MNWRCHDCCAKKFGNSESCVHCGTPVDEQKSAAQEPAAQEIIEISSSDNSPASRIPN